MNSKHLSHQNLSPIAVLSVAILAIFFGANAVAIKMSLKGLGELTTAGLRFGIAAVVISIWVKVTGGNLIVPRKQLISLLYLSIIFLFQLAFFYSGLGKTHASRATLIINLTPFITLILAHFLIPGDQITKRKIIGMIFGFAGLIILFLRADSFATSLRMGDFLVFLAAIMWSVNTVYTKHILEGVDPVHVTLYPMIFSAPFYLLGGYFWDENMIIRLDLEIVGAFLYQTLVTASIGFVIWNTMIKKYGATAIQSFTFVMPITGVLLGVVLLKEPMTINMLSAVILVAAGILVIHYHPKKPVQKVSIRSGL